MVVELKCHWNKLTTHISAMCTVKVSLVLQLSIHRGCTGLKTSFRHALRHKTVVTRVISARTSGSCRCDDRKSESGSSTSTSSTAKSIS